MAKGAGLTRLLVIAVLLSMGMLITYYAFNAGWVRFNYPDRERFPIRGIDVSHHQKKIRWERLRGENVQFVFIKATEGGDFKDPLFKYNWDGAQAAGLWVGAYHFFTLCKSGAEQADNFMATVPVEARALPPVIDLEFGGNCKARPDHETLHKQLKAYLRKVRLRYQREPILYCTYEFYNHYLTGQEWPNPIWIRDVFGFPKLADGRAWRFWQYANRGRLEGIDTVVDLNVFNGSVDEFAAFVKRRTNEPAPDS